MWRTGSRFEQEMLFDSRPHPDGPPSFGIITKRVYDKLNGQDHDLGFEDLRFWLKVYLRVGMVGQWCPMDDLFMYRRHTNGNSQKITRVHGDEEKARRVVIERAITDYSNALPDQVDLSQDLMLKSYKMPVNEKQYTRSVLFIIPWMDRGGADEYDLMVVRTLRDKFPDLHICIVTVEMNCKGRDRDFHYVDYRQLTRDIWHLCPVKRSNILGEFWDYLLTTRNVTHVWVRNVMIGYKLARKQYMNVKFIDILHLDNPGDKLGFEWTSRPFGQFMTKRVVISERLRDIVNDTDKIRVIPPAIDTLFWKCPCDNPRGMQTSNGKTRILWIGRWDPQKRPELFAKLCEELPDQYGCTMITDLPNGITQSIQSITVLPWIKDKQMLRKEMCRSRTKALVITSAYEGIPIVALQAISLGIRVIAFHGVGAMNEAEGIELVKDLDSMRTAIIADTTRGTIGDLPDKFHVRAFQGAIISLFQE